MFEDEFKQWTRDDAEKYCKKEHINNNTKIKLCRFLTDCKVKVENVKPVAMNPEDDLGVLTIHLLIKE